MRWKWAVLGTVVLGTAAALWWLLASSGWLGDDPTTSRARLQEHLTPMLPLLAPLHKELGPPQPGDWLSEHEEAGQTFEEYLDCDPITPDEVRRVLYLLPIGQFSDKQREVVTLTADYLERYFGLPVKFLPDLPLSDVPGSAQRRHPSWGMRQLLSTYFLRDVLVAKLPDDAAALLGLTAVDLWPGEGWSFVFGQASLRNRVGIWSIYRNGDPDASPADFRLCLLRTIKTATHELGHMFSMRHCTKYECNMCGSNNREESDSGPLALCPECMAKVCWATLSDPVKRYRQLTDFCQQHELKTEGALFEQLLARLEME